MQEIIKNTDSLMAKTIESLKRDLSGISTGRATPTLLEVVKVESYGSMMPLNRVANISATDSSTLIVQPWDKTLTHAIEKAIQNANLGFNPQVEGLNIRVVVPRLSEERRKELGKLAKKYGEEKKVSIRNERKDANEAFKKMKGTVSDDQIKQSENEIQKLTDKYNAEIDKLVEEKSKALMNN